MRQNVSHAVMSQRHEPRDSADDFPTPPWATRALFTHVLNGQAFNRLDCLEPACGRGDMVRPLWEYFGSVNYADAYAYGFAPVRDFLAGPAVASSVDWVVTNPPFKLARSFALRSLKLARRGVAILARTAFLESGGRYRLIFKNTPPAIMAQFVERVPMVRGRLDPDVTTATSYAWFVWLKDAPTTTATRLLWIPPCRASLTRPGDYPPT